MSFRPVDCLVGESIVWRKNFVGTTWILVRRGFGHFDAICYGWSRSHTRWMFDRLQYCGHRCHCRWSTDRTSTAIATGHFSSEVAIGLALGGDRLWCARRSAAGQRPGGPGVADVDCARVVVDGPASGSGSVTLADSKMAPSLCACLEHYSARQVLAAIGALRSIPGVLLALAIAAPWYVAVGVATDGQFIVEFLWRHNVGRAVSSMEGHNGGVLFYPLALLVGTFPWSLWLIPIAWWGIRAKRRGAAARTSVTLAAVWMTVTIVAFSFASTKLPSYITSCYPGVALLVGGFLKDFAASVRMPSRGWRTLAGAVAVTVAFCMATGLIWFSFAEALPLVGWVGCSSFLLALAGVGVWVADWQRKPSFVPAIWLSSAVGLHVALFGVGTHTVDGYREELDMLVAIDEDAQEHGQPARWFGLGGMEPSWVYYLDKPIEALPSSMLTDFEKLESWQELLKSTKLQPGDHLIVEGGNAERLQRAMQRWGTSQPPLIMTASTERFLRPVKLLSTNFKCPVATWPSNQVALTPDNHQAYQHAYDRLVGRSTLDCQSKWLASAP